MSEEVVRHYADRVGYTETQRESFREGGHRIRHVGRLAQAARRHAIEVEVVESRHCNSGHVVGQRLVFDVDGNLITALCPPRICLYLLSQLCVPVALINERLSEGLAPNDFHFMRHIRCPDAGVECLGYGDVRAVVRVVPRRPRGALRQQPAADQTRGEGGDK